MILKIGKLNIAFNNISKTHLESLKKQKQTLVL